MGSHEEESAGREEQGDADPPLEGILGFLGKVGRPSGESVDECKTGPSGQRAHRRSQTERQQDPTHRPRRQAFG
jgi:hypothetical protein